MTKKKRTKGFNKRVVQVVNPDDNFARLFEKSIHSPEYQKMLNEKAEIAKSNQKTSIGVQLKKYPAPHKTLDLHGHTVQEAQNKIHNFIQACIKKKHLSVRIIVGKGLHSSGAPVLPDAVERVLIQLKRQKKILAYRWEKKEKLKSGSLDVFLLSQ